MTGNNGSFIDLVVAGPDFSGTTTQIKDFIKYFKDNNFHIKDLRGTEIDALFHAERFYDLNHDYMSLREFLDDKNNIPDSKNYLLEEIYNLLSGRRNGADLLVASMVRNDCSTYINPDFADVWIMEEPTRRGAGQECRVFEQNASKFGSQMNGYRAALAHQAYRTSEFFRFRKPLRDAGKTIFKSRSEESACYNLHDVLFPTGASIDDYLKMPGHQIAFTYPPTHIFVVCGPVDWDKDAYLKLKAERTGERILDDYEKNYSYQLLVNQRYATDWIDNLYKKGCEMYGSKEPMILKFDIYNSKEKTKELMQEALRDVLSERDIQKI